MLRFEGGKRREDVKTTTAPLALWELDQVGQVDGGAVALTNRSAKWCLSTSRSTVARASSTTMSRSSTA
jgi:hypothetical protein